MLVILSGDGFDSYTWIKVPLCVWILTTIDLVREVLTIGVAVAHVLSGDAMSAAAFELGGVGGEALISLCGKKISTEGYKCNSFQNNLKNHNFHAWESCPIPKFIIPPP